MTKKYHVTISGTQKPISFNDFQQMGNRSFPQQLLSSISSKLRSTQLHACVSLKNPCDIISNTEI